MGAPYDIFFTPDTGQAVEGSTGPYASALDTFSSSFEAQSRVDSTYGMEYDVQERLQSSFDKYRQQTGTDIGMVPWQLGHVNDFVRTTLGEASGDPELRKSFLEANEKLKAARLPSMENIIDEVKKERAAIRKQAELDRENTGALGTAAGFLGSMAGSFTYRDPLNIMTLGVGGFGKSVVMRIATEMGAQGLIEGINQFTGVDHDLLGEKSNALENVLYAAGGAGLLRGGFEGLGKVVEKFAARNVVPPLKMELKLREEFAKQPDNPLARAGTEILDDLDQVEKLNPYGPAGLQKFEGELSEIYGLVSGKTSTAIGRVPQRQIDVPLEIRNLSDHEAAVAIEQPRIYEALQEARQKLEDVEASMAGIEKGLEETRLSDAVAMLDEGSGGLLRDLEMDLENPQLTKAQRESLFKKMDQVVQTLGEGRVEKALNDIRISPLKELQTSKASRKAAKKEYAAARRAMDQAVEKIKARENVKVLAGIKAAEPTVAEKIVKGEPVSGLVAYKHRVLETTTAAAAKAEEALPDLADNLLARITDEDGMIDIGLGGKVRADATLVVTRENGDQVTMTYADIVKELYEDEAMVKAMGQCAI